MNSADYSSIIQAYIVGLVFSLHTHVDMVWKSNTQRGVNATTYYQRLMPSHIISQLMHHHHQADQQQQQQQDESDSQGFSSGVKYGSSPVVALSHIKEGDHTISSPSQISGLQGTSQEGAHISYASIASGSSSIPAFGDNGNSHQSANITTAYLPPKDGYEEEGEEEEGAGHDSPNWSKGKSFFILFGCTLLYSIIAEILVDTVDEVMKDFPMDEKFLGLTLFALVPNITEFMNAISFALYGNIVLSMEIGSAYALQVCLLQIPAMVAFSIWYNYGKEELAKFTFR